MEVCVRVLRSDEKAELFVYDTQTGSLTRRTARGGKQAGSTAGGTDSYGYRQVGIDGRLYLVSRVAWLYVYGVWPALEVDHIDGNRANNAIANLRLATRGVNVQNARKPRKTNRLGVLGVGRYKDKFKAQISHAGRVHYLGLHATADLAHAAYVEAKRRLHKGCTL